MTTPTSPIAHGTLNRLHALRLPGMAAAFSEQLQTRAAAELPFEEKDDAVCVYPKDAAAALDVLSRFREIISDFEVTKGSLNEVFLAVTGKEIREA